MSAETDFRAALLAHAPLAALVGGRVAFLVAPQGAPLPIVVFNAAHQPQPTLGGGGDELISFTAECWADTAESALAVADAVQAAVEAFDTASTSTSATVLDRNNAFDAESGLTGVVLTVEWWP